MLKEQYSSAKHCFTAAIEQNPDFACAYTMRADAENKLKDLDSARADLDKAIAIAPEEWTAYFIRGLLSGDCAKNDYEDYSHVVELCPEFPYTYINRAPMQEQYGTSQKALDDYNKFIALEPHYSCGYSGKADLELRTGNLLGAYLDCNKAIELDPQNYQAYHTRGQLRQQLFDSTGALADHKKSLGY
jgi:tetratricopeptide (TPR) repeat protein